MGKKKFWEASKTLTIAPIDQYLEIVYTNNINKSREKRSKKLGKLKKKFAKEVDGLCAYHKGHFSIFITPESSLGTIAHEAYHRVIALFDYIRVQDYDEELVAYQLGFIVDRIMNFIREENDKK